MMRVQDKVALVTGGTSGIAREAAIPFARVGAKPVVAGLRQGEGSQVVNAVTEFGGEAVFTKTHITDEAQVKHLADKTLRRFGILKTASKYPSRRHGDSRQWTMSGQVPC